MLFRRSHLPPAPPPAKALPSLWVLASIAGMTALLLSINLGNAQSPRALDQPPQALPSKPGSEPPANAPSPRAADPKAADPKATDPKAAEPKSKQVGPPPSKSAPGKAAQGKKDLPGLAVQQPRTPAEREKALSDLYAHLATAADEKAATTVATNIERLWLTSGSDTVSLLMERSAEAVSAKDNARALRFLNAVVALAPDYAEGWNRRAYVYFSDNNVQGALGDLRRVLALDANHFKALDGLAHILKEIGQKKAALAATRKLLEVHPFADGAKSMHDELAREVEGQSL